VVTEGIKLCVACQLCFCMYMNYIERETNLFLLPLLCRAIMFQSLFDVTACATIKSNQTKLANTLQPTKKTVSSQVLIQYQSIVSANQPKIKSNCSS
jgi:hypothetical protein